MKSSLSLRQRIFLLTGVALLPAFAMIVENEVSSRREREAEAEEHVLRMSELAATELQRALTGAATLMIAIAEAPAVQARDEEACEAYIHAVNVEVPQIFDLSVTDGNGTVFCHTGSSEEGAFARANAHLFDVLTEERFAIGSYTETPSGPVLPMGMGIRGEGDAPEGHVLLGINLKALEEIAFADGLPPDSTLIVADSDGRVLAHRPATGMAIGDILPTNLHALATASASGSIRSVGVDAVEYFFGYQPLTERMPLSVIFGLPAEAVMRPINFATLRASAITLAGAVVAFMFAWLIGQFFIRRPVLHVVRTIRRWRAGDTCARTGMIGDATELHIIGGSIDQLFDELRRRQEAQRQAEEQRDLLAGELQHRIKNLLAVIQVIGRQTLGKQQSVPEVKVFQDRIGVLIRAHDPLLKGQVATTGLAETVALATEPFAGSDGMRIERDGPDIELPPRMSLALSLALHELGTNAAKYGALSVPSGRVRVAWTVEDGRLRLQWSESGGPAVENPGSTGFGSMMIRQALEAESEGEVTLSYEPDGLVFIFCAPLEKTVTE